MAVADPSATVTDPPPAGTVLDPEPVVIPLATVTAIVAPPQEAGNDATVTLTTLLPELLDVTLRAALVHPVIEVQAAPIRSAAKSTFDAAARTALLHTSTAVASRTLGTPTMRIGRLAGGAIGLGKGARMPPRPRKVFDQPLMTTPMPVTAAASIAGENVAAKLAPLAGVVPVASPSDASPEPDNVIRYAFE